MGPCMFLPYNNNHPINMNQPSPLPPPLESILPPSPIPILLYYQGRYTSPLPSSIPAIITMSPYPYSSPSSTHSSTSTPYIWWSFSLVIVEFLGKAHNYLVVVLNDKEDISTPIICFPPDWVDGGLLIRMNINKMKKWVFK